tara:strand:- start:1526 stop:1783 length:258 start_codon:yes stop_codon:yes gene_type:complete
MRDIEFITAKNKLEILAYKVENKYRNVDIPEESKSVLDAIYHAISVLIRQDSDIEILKNQIIDIKLQNIDAYKQTAELKKKIKWA